MTTANIVERLRDDIRQLQQMKEQAAFAGAETGVRVKSPDILLADLTEAADALAARPFMPAGKPVAERSAKLERIIRDTLWMARRYAHGRQSYAVGMYNDAARQASELVSGLNASDGSMFAIDGGERHRPEMSGLSQDEYETACRGLDAVGITPAHPLFAHPVVAPGVEALEWGKIGIALLDFANGHDRPESEIDRDWLRNAGMTLVNENAKRAEPPARETAASLYAALSQPNTEQEAPVAVKTCQHDWEKTNEDLCMFVCAKCKLPYTGNVLTNQPDGWTGKYQARSALASHPASEQQPIDWEKMARAQSRKLHAVLHLPGVKEELAKLVWDAPEQQPMGDAVAKAIESVDYICGRWEKNQGASSLTLSVRMLLAALASSPTPAAGNEINRMADAIDAARYAHPQHPRERPQSFTEAGRSDREYAFRLARAAWAVIAPTPAAGMVLVSRADLDAVLLAYGANSTNVAIAEYMRLMDHLAALASPAVQKEGE